MSPGNRSDGKVPRVSPARGNGGDRFSLRSKSGFFPGSGNMRGSLSARVVVRGKKEVSKEMIRDGRERSREQKIVSKLEDPTYLGPGVWRTIHLETFLARTPEEQRNACYLIRRACLNFPCQVCRGHCSEYIERNPPEKNIGAVVAAGKGEGLPIGIFVWGWTFHNAVNSRLGKPTLEWEQAFQLYQDTKNCCQEK